MKNFEFTYKGLKYWYSRANVCVTAVFCKDDKGSLYILLNKRGTATNNEQHKWNMPVGYLDFGETLKECAIREVYEETGITLPELRVKLFNIKSKPEHGDEKLDIGFRFYCMLFGTIDDYEFSLDNMEEDEVEQVLWVNIHTLDSIDFAWNHKEIIMSIIQKKFSYLENDTNKYNVNIGKKIYEMNLGLYNKDTKLFENTKDTWWNYGKKTYNNIKYSIFDNTSERCMNKLHELSYLYEGLIYSADPQKVVSILNRDCEGFIFDIRIVNNPLSIEKKTSIIDFCIPVKYFDDPIYGLLAYKEVKQIINILGYFISSKKKRTNLIDFVIMPKYIIDVTSQIYDSNNNDGILYHITPLKNKQKILNKGLIPRRVDKCLDNYPDRVYFYLNMLERSLELLCKDLSKDTNITDWLVLRIDLKDRRSYKENDISTMYKFYDDPKAQYAVFTYENIDPLCISIYKEIHI